MAMDDIQPQIALKDKVAIIHAVYHKVDEFVYQMSRKSDQHQPQVKARLSAAAKDSAVAAVHVMLKSHLDFVRENHANLRLGEILRDEDLTESRREFARLFNHFKFLHEDGFEIVQKAIELFWQFDHTYDRFQNALHIYEAFCKGFNYHPDAGEVTSLTSLARTYHFMHAFINDVTLESVEFGRDITSDDLMARAMSSDMIRQHIRQLKKNLESISGT